MRPLPIELQFLFWVFLSAYNNQLFERMLQLLDFLGGRRKGKGMGLYLGTYGCIKDD
jgi:hypothetical protein